MNGEIGDWKIVSKEVPKYMLREAFLDLLGAVFFWGPLTPERLIKFTVRQKSTGYIKIIRAYRESDLPALIAKGLLQSVKVFSEDEGELILTGIRSGGEARVLAFNSIEYAFRLRLQKGDIDPHELFTGLQEFLRPAGEEAIQEFTRRCFPFLPLPKADERSPDAGRR